MTVYSRPSVRPCRVLGGDIMKRQFVPILLVLSLLLACARRYLIGKEVFSFSRPSDRLQQPPLLSLVTVRHLPL